METLYGEQRKAIKEWLLDRFPDGDPGLGSPPEEREGDRWGVRVDDGRRFLYVSEAVYREFTPDQITAALNDGNAEGRLRAGGPSLWLRTHPADRNRLTVMPWPHGD